MHRKRPGPWRPSGAEDEQGDCEAEGGEGPPPRDPVGHERRAGEGDREGREVSPERRDPQEGMRDDVGREVGTHRDEEGRGDGGEGQHPPGPRRGAKEGARGRPGANGRGSAGEQDEGREEGRERNRVDEALALPGESRLEHQGIGEERAERPQVRGRVEEIGVLAPGVVRAREPCGNEGGDEGGRDEGRADLHREGGEEPPHRIRAARRLSEREGAPRREGEGGGEPHEGESGDVAPRRERPREEVGEGVAREQRELEER